MMQVIAALVAVLGLSVANAQSAMVKITDPQDDYPAVSPDGGRIIFQSNRSGNWQLWMVARDGSRLQRMTSNAFNDRQPAWSPDGRQVALSSDRGLSAGNRAIWLLEYSEGQLGKGRQISAGSGQDIHPKWLSDGSGLVYNRIGAHGKQATIHITMLAGGDRAIELGAGLNTYASADPSGRYLVYRGTSVEQGADGPFENSDIFKAAVDGSGKIRLTDDPAFDGWPAISPDGSKIAFASRRSADKFRIFLMPADGGAATEISTPPGFNYTQPAWTPDGRTLIAYRWLQDAAGEFGQLVQVALP